MTFLETGRIKDVKSDLLIFDVHPDNFESRIVFLEVKSKAESFIFALVVGDGEGAVLVFLALEGEFKIRDRVFAEKILQHMRGLLVAVNAFFAQNGDQKLVVAHFSNSICIFFHESRFDFGVRHISRRAESYKHEREESEYKFHTPNLAKIIP